VSPFLLLSLKTHLEGVEAAVLRSALEIAALDNLAWLETADRPLDLLSELDDIETPDLSLDASLELIRRTGLDPQLLSLLGIKDDGPYPESDSEVNPDPPVVVPPLIPEPVRLLDLHIKVCDPATGLLSELSTDPVVVDPEVPPAPAETTETEEEKQSPVTEVSRIVSTALLNNVDISADSPLLTRCSPHSRRPPYPPRGPCTPCVTAEQGPPTPCRWPSRTGPGPGSNTKVSPAGKWPPTHTGLLV